MDIQKLLHSPEGKTLEFKRDASSLKPIMKTIISFANTAGGIIVIGKKDSGELLGVDDPLGMEEQLSNAISDSISPTIIPDIDIISFEGKSLLLIRVSHWPGPFYLKSEGNERGVYIRLGSTSREAGPEFIAEIGRQQQNKSFDQLPCPEYGAEALDISFIQEKFSKFDREINEQQLVSLGLLTPFAGRNVVTYGGLILCGHRVPRQMVLPDARVSCARFKGDNKAHFIDKLDLEGSILEAIEYVPHFIQRNTRLFPKIDGMVREDIPAYPPYAIREILVNSVVHCDYSLIGMRVMIAVFSDRIEIQSPGMFPFGMTLEDFESGVSRIRNRVVARTFKELGIMEEWGSCYKRVADYCRGKGYPTPKWQEIGPVVRVILYPHAEAREVTPPVTPPVTPQVKKLLTACDEVSGRKELQKCLKIKNKKYFLENYLKPAIEQGFIEMTIPDKPNSSQQQYRLTELALLWQKEEGL